MGKLLWPMDMWLSRTKWKYLKKASLIWLRIIIFRVCQRPVFVYLVLVLLDAKHCKIRNKSNIAKYNWELIKSWYILSVLSKSWLFVNSGEFVNPILIYFIQKRVYEQVSEQKWCARINKCAASCQNQQNDCAPSEDSDQPRHPHSMIRVFAVRSMGS